MLILGAPRTGSTLLYQAMVRFFRLPYFSNLANDVFPTRPALAAPLHRDMLPAIKVEFTSAYGKTRGAFQPSEASGVMRHWFGGGHPSQLKSVAVLDGKAEHMAKTLAVMDRYFGAPAVIKNAWNCFRVASLAGHLPRAFFVWLRRDMTASALSDLAARYVVQGTPDLWNSATPAIYEELQRTLPYWAQVVENQYEFTVAIRDGLARHAPDRYVEVWYEDLLRDPSRFFTALARRMRDVIADRQPTDVGLEKGETPAKPFRPSDEANLRAYVEEHRDRLADCRYRGGGRT